MAKQQEDSKEKNLSDVLAKVRKDHGNEAIAQLAGQVGRTMPHIPTGLYTVDREVLGIGGIPRGRITEMFGAHSGGKSSLAQLAVAEAQKMGDLAAYIDAEHALDVNWAKKLGVDVDKLIINQPDYG